jgi:hypothetical protein
MLRAVKAGANPKSPPPPTPRAPGQLRCEREGTLPTPSSPIAAGRRH